MFLGEATAMQDTVTALTTNITPSSILSPVTDMLPWIGGMVAVALGLYFIRRAIKKISKAKAGI